MKMSQNTPDLLIIDDRPWLLGGILIGFITIFTGIGVAMLFAGLLAGIVMFLIAGSVFAAFYFLVERTQLVLDARTGQLEIRKKSMRRMKRSAHALKDLRHTTVEARVSTGSTGAGSNISRLILVMREGHGETNTPLTSALTSGGAAEKISPIVNAWLAAARA
ncbi:MAG TPA: hypothetical protein EYG79_12945 [Rhodobacteraceae bacterium]|nr:hypothetical protein [Paracoccaceae bacterium]